MTAPVGVPPDNLVDATYYNLAVAVDPNKPNTVLFANIRLWRSEDAGQTWSDVSLGTSPTANVSLHGDQHAIAFHPTAAGRLYVGNDGGVYRSNDGCANWISCNKGLQITQFNALSSAAPTAMIAGAQDNGVQGYFGDPAFTLLVIGDGGAVEAPAAWPPATPRRWYAAQAAGNYRGVSWSDTPAIPKLWNPPQDAGLPPLNDPSDTYAHFPPFVNTPWGLVYATSRLWLQPAPGQPWQSIIGKLAQATGATITTLHFTSVKIDPLNTEYSLAVGTSDGLFFRVTPPSSNNAAWTPQQYWGLSGAPVKQVSSTFWPGEGLRFVAVTGGFSGPHVWTTEQGITFTPATSPLLLETNPANCVHAETGTIFVGCDVGIFQSSNWGENWQRVDAGLPNVAVMDMEVGATTRVATYGRGIWEVSTGTPGAPVNVGLRHSDYDNGNLRLPMLGPSFPPILRPPLPVRGCPELESGYLMSPDLRIDTPDPSGKYQTPGTAIDFAQFATMTDCYPVAGRTMRVFLQVRNGGPNLATGVKARLYWCTKRNTPLDSLPAGFLGHLPGCRSASGQLVSDRAVQDRAADPARCAAGVGVRLGLSVYAARRLHADPARCRLGAAGSGQSRRRVVAQPVNLRAPAQMGSGQAGGHLPNADRVLDGADGGAIPGRHRGHPDRNGACRRTSRRRGRGRMGGCRGHCAPVAAGCHRHDGGGADAALAARRRSLCGARYAGRRGDQLHLLLHLSGSVH